MKNSAPERPAFLSLAGIDMNQTVAQIITPDAVLDPLMLQLSRLLGIRDAAPYGRISIVPFQPLHNGQPSADHQCAVAIYDAAIKEARWSGLVDTESLIALLGNIADPGRAANPLSVDALIDAFGSAVRDHTLRPEPQEIARKVVTLAQVAYQGDYLYQRIVEALWRTIPPRTTELPPWVNTVPTGSLYYFARAETERVLGTEYEGVEFASMVDDDENHLLLLSFNPLPRNDEDEEEDDDDSDDSDDDPESEEATDRLEIDPTSPEDNGSVNAETAPTTEPAASKQSESDDLSKESPTDESTATTVEGETDTSASVESDQSPTPDAQDSPAEGSEGETDSDDAESDDGDTHNEDDDDDDDDDDEEEELVHPVTYYFDTVVYLSFIRGLDDAIGREALFAAADESELDLLDDEVNERTQVITAARGLSHNTLHWLINDVTATMFRSLKSSGAHDEATHHQAALTAAAEGVRTLCETVAEILAEPAMIDNNPMLEDQGKMIWRSGANAARSAYKIRHKKPKGH